MQIKTTNIFKKSTYERIAAILDYKQSLFLLRDSWPSAKITCRMETWCTHDEPLV